MAFIHSRRMHDCCAGLSQCEGLSYGDVADCLPNWLKFNKTTNAKTAIDGQPAMLCPVLEFWRPNASLPSFVQVGTCRVLIHVKGKVRIVMVAWPAKILDCTSVPAVYAI